MCSTILKAGGVSIPEEEIDTVNEEAVALIEPFTEDPDIWKRQQEAKEFLQNLEERKYEIPITSDEVIAIEKLVKSDDTDELLAEALERAEEKNQELVVAVENKPKEDDQNTNMENNPKQIEETAPGSPLYEEKSKS